MTELKDSFSAATIGEPPVRTSIDALVSRGRQRQRMRAAAGSVAGFAVAGLVVTTVVTLRPTSSADVTAGDTSSSSAPAPSAKEPVPTPTDPVPSPTEPANSPVAVSTPVPTDVNTGLTATPNPAKSDPAGWQVKVEPGSDLARVLAARVAKLDAIVAVTRQHLEAAGYTVLDAGPFADDLLNPDFPAGDFGGKLTVSDGTHHGAVIVQVGTPNVAPDPAPATCPTGYAHCSLTVLATGQTAMFETGFRETNGVYGRHVLVWSTPGAPSSLAVLGSGFDASYDLTIPDKLMAEMAADSVFNLDTVPRFTAAELALVRAQFAASPRPTTSPLPANATTS